MELPTVEADPEPTKAPGERITVALRAELMERVRNAVYWTLEATPAGLVEDAVGDARDDLEREHGAASK